MGPADLFVPLRNKSSSLDILFLYFCLCGNSFHSLPTARACTGHCLVISKMILFVFALYWKADKYRRDFEVFSVNFRNLRIDHDKISIEESKDLLTHSVNFVWISVHSNTICCGGKLIGIRGTGRIYRIKYALPFWKYKFEFIFCYVECSYLVNINPNNCRISFYSPQSINPNFVSISEVVFSETPPPPTVISYLNIFRRRKYNKIYNISFADVNTCVEIKILNLIKNYPEKQSVVIIG